MSDTSEAMNQPIQPKPQICSICGDYFRGHGNNAWPVNPGRCCDRCNDIVVTHRIRNGQRGLNAHADPEWYAQIVTSVTEFWQEHKKQEEAKNQPTHDNPIQMGASLPPAGQASTGATA